MQNNLNSNNIQYLKKFSIILLELNIELTNLKVTENVAMQQKII